MVRKSKAVISSLASTKYYKLSAKDKVTHNTTTTIMGMVNAVNSPKTVIKMQKSIKEKKRPLGLKEGLKEWQRRNNK